MNIRSYRPSDKEEVLKLIQENTPKFFAPEETKDLANYLDQEREDYFVVEENETVIGAGGINYFPSENTARISWDMISPKHHGRGIGKALTQYRIDHIKKQKKFAKIIVRTSQLAYLFYEKNGFHLVSIEEDYWAKDYHLYLMGLELSE